MAARIGIDYRPALLTNAGIGRSVRELCRALGRGRANGVEVHLFGHSLGRARRDDPVPDGCRLHRLPVPGRSLPLLSRFGLDAGRLCGRAAVFHWTDCIHPPVTAARTVLTVHDLAFAADPSFHGVEQSRVLLERCRAAARQAERILCPTQATADMVYEHLGRDTPVTVIPFGCDHVPPNPGAHPLSGSPYVLCVGTIEPRKNHGGLLAAWRELSEPRPRLVVIGRRGWECDGIVAELERAEMEEDVEWLEDPPDATVYTYIAHAEVLVYPSRLEGFGFPPLEAMTLGTPVLVGDTPALREVLGDAAQFCDPDRHDELAARLAQILEDRDRRQELITKGRQRAAGFTWRRSAEDHLMVYEEVYRGGRG